MSDNETRSGAAHRDYELADTIDVDTPQRLKALADPLRMHLVDLVLERAMSVTELAARVGRPRGTVAYHVEQLVDAGLLQVVRTRRVRAIEERFYGRAARTYVMPHQPGELPFLRNVIADVDHDALERGSETKQGDAAATPGMATYRRARVPADRVAEYCERLHRLALEFVDEPRDGDTEFGMYLAVFPVTHDRPTTS